MKDKRQKLAIFSVAVLLVFSVITGLVKPYIQNKGNATIDKNNSREGKVAVPNFEFMDGDGNVVDFDSFKGKPIVINFWGTWCPWCVAEMEDFNKIAGEYSEDVNFLFLDVANSEEETVEKVENFLEEKGFDNITSHYDNPGYGIYMFGINSYPTTVYVDADGNLFDAAIGRTNYTDIKAALDRMLAQ